VSAPRFVVQFAGALADELALMGSQGWALAQVLTEELGTDVGDPGVPSALVEAGTAAASLSTQLAGKEPEQVDIATVNAEASTLLAALLALPDALDGWGPDGVDGGDLRRALLRLPEILILRATARVWPLSFDLCVMAGAVRGAPIAPQVDLDRLDALARDPAATLSDLIWPEAFAAADERILETLARLLRRLGLPTHVHERWPLVDDAEADLGGGPAGGDGLQQLTIPFVELALSGEAEGGGETETDAGAEGGLVLAPAALRGSGTVDGLLLTNYGQASLVVSQDLDPLTFEAGLDVDAERVLVAGAAPGFARVETGTAGANARFSVTVSPEPPTEDAAFKCGGAVASVQVSADTSASPDPELAVTLATVPADGEDRGLAVEFALPEPDGFLSAIVGDATLTAGADLGLAWSSSSGLAINAVAGLLFESFPGTDVGPFTLLRTVVGLEAGTGGIRGLLAADIGAELGPVTAVVEGVGAAAELSRADDGEGSLGSLDLRWTPLVPTGLGFAVDTPAAKGGGYLSYDPDGSRYSGVVDLTMLETAGLTAVVEVTTGTEEAPSDWSFLMSLSLSFGPITLPYGFFLLGAGGLLGLHRDFDADALGQRLASGALESVMFPDDPIAEAPRVLDDLRSIFPQRTGQHVVGPFVRIGWGGVKPFLQVDLGLLLALPDPSIGLVANAVFQIPPVGTPEPEGTEATGVWPPVRLKMAVLGVLDLEDRSVWIKGSLYDSQVVGIALSGDNAFYARFGDDPFFLLSIGGYHPDWTPPDTLPQALQQLQRLGARFEVSPSLLVDVSSYLALTANTLQLGAEFSLQATAEFGPWTFGVEGSSEFHAIAEFSPFHLDVLWRLDISVLAGSGEMLGATLEAEVYGPDPWIVHGFAEFRFLGTDVRLRFQIEGQEGSTALPSADVLDDIIAALELPSAWTATAVEAVAHLHPALEWDDETPLLAPDASLQVAQQVVPLGVAIDRVGESRPADDNLFAIDGAWLGGSALEVAALEPVEGEFSPARYFDLDGAARLRAPAVETHPAGVVLAGGWELASDGEEIADGWQEEIVDPLCSDDAHAPGLLGPGPRRVAAAPVVTGGPRVALSAPTWTVRGGGDEWTTDRFAEALTEARRRGPAARIEEAG